MEFTVCVLVCDGQHHEEQITISNVYNVCVSCLLGRF